jgi:hypothetical protein
MRNKMNDETVEANASAHAMQALTGTQEQLANVQVKSAKALAEQNMKLAEARIRLSDTTTTQNRYNEAVAKGATKGATEANEFIAKTEEQTASEAGFRSELFRAIPGLNQFAGATDLSTDKLKELVEIIKGAPDAVRKFEDSLNKIATGVFDKLAEAMDKGKKELKATLKEMEKAAGFKFSPELKLVLKEGGEIQRFKNQTQAGFETLVAVISLIKVVPRAQSAAIEIIDKMMANIQSNMNAQAPSLNMQNVLSALQAVRDDVAQGIPDASKFRGDLFTLQQAADAAGVSIDLTGGTAITAGGQLGTFGGAAQGQVNPVNQFNNAVAQIGSTFATMGAAIDAALKRLPGFFATAFAHAAANATVAMMTLQTSMQNMFLSNLPGIVNRGLSAVLRTSTNGFAAIATSATVAIQKLQTNVVTAFMSNIPGAIQRGVDKARSSVNTAFAAISGNIAGHIATSIRTVNSLQTAINSLKGKNVPIAAVIQKNDVPALQRSINSLRGNTVRVNAVIGVNQVGQLQRSINSLQGRTVTVNVIQRVQRVFTPFAPAAAAPVAGAPAAPAAAAAAAPAIPAAAAAAPLGTPAAFAGSLTVVGRSMEKLKDESDTQFKAVESNISKYIRLATTRTDAFNSVLENTTVNFDAAGASSGAFGKNIDDLNTHAQQGQIQMLLLNAHILVTKFFSDFAAESVNKLADALDRLTDRTVNVAVNQTTVALISNSSFIE